MTPTLAPTPDVDELDAIAHLEQDWSIACEFREVDRSACGATAAWWVICRACGSTAAECHAHRISEAATWALWNGSVVCCRCWTRIRAREWRDLFVITPIGTRA